MTAKNKKPKYTDESVEALLSNPKNARTHSGKQVDKLAKSIKEFGFINPIVIDSKKVIYAGHGRLEAAKKLKLETVPCVDVSYLTAKEKRAYMLADNRIAIESGWDEEILKNELEELQALDFDLSITGFDDDEIDGFFAQDIEPTDKDDEIPTVTKIKRSKLGDVWILGNHRLMCGDSTDPENAKKLFNGEKIDTVFADPPYGISVVQGAKVGGGGIVESSEYKQIIGDETTETAEDFYNLCLQFEIKNIFLWGGNYFTDFLPPSRCWIVWDKEMTGNFSEAEMAWSNLTKGGIKVFKFLWNGLTREGGRDEELKKRVHPTQKPVGLFINIFKKYGKFKNVFDGFGGSGSTLIACEKAKKNCFMMELDPHYVDVIITRWQDFTGKKAHREADNVLFDDLN